MGFFAMEKSSQLSINGEICLHTIYKQLLKSVTWLSIAGCISSIESGKSSFAPIVVVCHLNILIQNSG